MLLLFLAQQAFFLNQDDIVSFTPFFLIGKNYDHPAQIVD